jgi:hypothetical protein
VGEPQPQRAATGVGAGATGAAAGGTGEGDRERDRLLAERIAARHARERAGLRRLRLGPGSGSAFISPGMLGAAGSPGEYTMAADRELDREIDLIARALEEHGEVRRAELILLLEAQSWGPGRYRAALRAAVREGRIVTGPRHAVGPRA